MKTKTGPDCWILLCFFIASVLNNIALGASTELSARRPNVILILTDDQGYGDLGCHGNPIIKTPNIDRLHGESVRFTDFHVSPTCAPTRSALLSGRHEFRSGVTHTILERERMSLKTTTYAQILKTAGYATGIFGKWHLGDEPERWPDKRGFDEMFIHGAGGIGQTYPGSCGDAPGNRYFDPAIPHNGKFEKTKGYCTDVLPRLSVGLRNEGQGTVLLPHLAQRPHAPLDVPEKYEKMFADKVPAAVAKFDGMIYNIDENVGKLMAKLREWGIGRDTLVTFMTDNGGTAGVRTFNAGMRSQRGTPYDGGTRVPSVWRWPGTLALRRQPARRAHRLFSHLGGVGRCEDSIRGRGQIGRPQPRAAPAGSRCALGGPNLVHPCGALGTRPGGSGEIPEWFCAQPAFQYGECRQWRPEMGALRPAQ